MHLSEEGTHGHGSSRTRTQPGTAVEKGSCAAIADDIVSGRQLPHRARGSTKASLALQRFAVSRTPVREALGQLSAMGLIDRRPNRGAVVAVLSDDYLALDVRGDARARSDLCAAGCRKDVEQRTPAAGSRASGRGDGLVHLWRRGRLYSAHNTDFHTRSSIRAGRTVLTSFETGGPDAQPSGAVPAGAVPHSRSPHEVLGRTRCHRHRDPPSGCDGSGGRGPRSRLDRQRRKRGIRPSRHPEDSRTSMRHRYFARDEWADGWLGACELSELSVVVGGLENLGEPTRLSGAI